MNESLKKYGYYSILSIIFILGFLLRLKWLLVNPSFWDDECSIAWNVVHKNYLDFFGVLDYLQVAPPFFMITSKLFTHFFGISDFSLRLSPFLFGILSMVMFFVISGKIFKNKITIITSTLIFSINQAMVGYSSEFKQYSCDIFFTLLSLYLFFDIIKNQASIKKIIIYSIILAMSIWFSFSSVFIIGAGFIVLLFKQIKEKSFDIKKSLILFLPFLISCLICLKTYIIANYAANIGGLMGYWSDSFIAKDFSNLLYLMKKDIDYFFFPLPSVFPVVIALITGIYVFFKKDIYLALLLILTILLEGFFSWLGFYPFEKRVVLFLFPILLLFISAIFELFNSKEKIKSLLIVILFFLIFAKSFTYSMAFIKEAKPSRGYYSREMMGLMMSKIKPDDTIVVNKYSRTDFAYYSTYYKIKNRVIQESWNSDGRTFLNNLKPKQYYWFYTPFGPSRSFGKWFANDKRKIIFEINGTGFPCKLVYFYVK